MQEFQNNVYFAPQLPSPGQYERETYNSRSSYHYISRSLFGFMPMLMSEVATLPAGHSLHSPCGLCSKPYAGNQGFSSTVMKLQCTSEHHFHLKCIFDFWDQPGKYLHRCPTCREAAQLNWERVGLDYKKSLRFAHNLSGWPVSQDTLAHLRDDTPAGQRARDLYDVPPLPDSRDRTVPNPNDINDDVLLFWMQQNMSIICALENPISWTGRTFDAGERPRVLNPVLDRQVLNARENLSRTHSANINPYPFDFAAKELGRRWMRLEFDTRGRRRDPEQNVWGMETRRKLPGVRHYPATEAAWARSLRRRRDRERRERVREGELGLGNLPGV
jgi:hypothetical protein